MAVTAGNTKAQLHYAYGRWLAVLLSVCQNGDST